MYTYICMYKYLHIHIYIYVYIHIYIYLYIYTHTRRRNMSLLCSTHSRHFTQHNNKHRTDMYSSFAEYRDVFPVHIGKAWLFCAICILHTSWSTITSIMRICRALLRYTGIFLRYVWERHVSFALCTFLVPFPAQKRGATHHTYV